MSLDITIRPAGIADIPLLSALLHQLFTIESDFLPNTETQSQGLRLLINSPDSLVLIAEVDKNPIGMCSLQFLISTAMGTKVAILEDLIIDKHYRGKKVGSKILDFAVNYCLYNNLPRMQLLADVSNTSAINFYVKHGWKRTQLVNFFNFPTGE